MYGGGSEAWLGTPMRQPDRGPAVVGRIARWAFRMERARERGRADAQVMSLSSGCDKTSADREQRIMDEEDETH